MQLKRLSTEPRSAAAERVFRFWSMEMHKITDKTALLESLLEQRILILDGAMGTMIQAYKLAEDGYRGPVACGLHDHAHDLKGDNDLLVITRPEIVREIHNRFREGGAVCDRHLFRGARHPAATDRFGHDYRRFGAHALRPDTRSFLGLGATRKTAGGGSQLRARRRFNASVHRGNLARRGHLRLMLSERGLAQSYERYRLRRNPRDHRELYGRRRQDRRREEWSTALEAEPATHPR